MKNQTIKILFGFVIFLFSLALGYFTANYLSSNSYFDYWGTLAIFAGAYVLIGVLVSMIFSVSWGFLFAADILIIHLLFQYYGQWADVLKLTTIGAILIILYIAAGLGLGDKSGPAVDSTAPAASAPVPPPTA